MICVQWHHVLFFQAWNHKRPLTHLIVKAQWGMGMSCVMLHWVICSLLCCVPQFPSHVTWCKPWRDASSWLTKLCTINTLTFEKRKLKKNKVKFCFFYDYYLLHLNIFNFIQNKLPSACIKIYISFLLTNLNLELLNHMWVCTSTIFFGFVIMAKTFDSGPELWVSGQVKPDRMSSLHDSDLSTAQCQRE